MSLSPLRPLALTALLLTATAATAEMPGVRTDPAGGALPAGAVVLTDTDLRRLNVHSLLDALDSVGGVMAQRRLSGRDGQASLDLLGFGASASGNVLVLLNGRPLHNLSGDLTRLQAIPLATVARIEVLPATGAVLYGQGASAGLINIVTRQDRESGATLQLQGGSDHTLGTELSGSAASDAGQALLGVRRLHSDGDRDNSRLDQGSAFIDLRRELDDSTLYLTALAGREEVGLPGALSGNLYRDHPRRASTPLDTAEQDHYLVNPGLVVRGAWADLYVEGSWQRTDRHHDRYSLAALEQDQLETWGFTPRVSGQLATGALSHRWTLGMDLYKTSWRQQVSGQQDADLDQRQEAWYLHNITTLRPDLFLTLGARSEKTTQRIDLPGGGAGELDARYELYEGGLTWQPAPVLALFINGSRTARVPLADEWRQASPNLRPQTGTLYSAGGRWEQGIQRSVFTYFRGRYQHELWYDPQGTLVNLDDRTRRDGYMLNSHWALNDQLTMTFNYTLQRSRFMHGAYGRNDVPGVPHRSHYLAFDWQARPWLAFTVTQRYVAQRYTFNDPANQYFPKQRSYYWTDLAATVQWQRYRVRASVHNLQDKPATDLAWTDGVQSDAYPLPGRYFLLSAEVSL